MFNAKEIIGNAMALSAGCVNEEKESDFLNLLNLSISDLSDIAVCEPFEVADVEETVNIDAKYYAVLSYMTASHIAFKSENLPLAAFYQSRALDILDMLGRE